MNGIRMLLGVCYSYMGFVVFLNKKEEFFVSTTENSVGVFQLGTDRLTGALNQSGYRTVFDITSESLSEFEKNNSEIPSSDIKEIYRLATQRTENLRMLYKAWQLHNDPIVKNIPKLSSNTGTQGMHTALKRSLGGGANFEDLFPERSPEGYAGSTSIQSLFSPGRYLTVLYKIARQLHDSKDKMHIDNRRPDLQSLILSEDNMNKEVSSLDILLDVLQPDDSSTMKSLKDTYYPMTLPYDDDLMQINAVAESHSTDLLGIWNTLSDTQRKIILQEPKLNGIYKIKTVLKVTMGVDVEQTSNTYKNVHLYQDNVTGRSKWNFHYVRKLNAYQIYNVGYSNEVLTWDITNDSNNVYVTVNEYKEEQYWIVEDVGNDYYIIKNKKNPSLVLNVTNRNATNRTNINLDHRNETEAQKFKLKPVAGVYQFTLTENETGDGPASVSEEITPITDVGPSPRTRETLSLTPNSFQLLVNPNLTMKDIANHYNVKTTDTLDSAELTAALNDVENFCIKTGLSFNELLELIMLKDYQIKYKSRFLKFDSTENVPVSTYGAVFLTGTEEIPLWVLQGTTTTKLAPEADAYVHAGDYATHNFGSSDELKVQGGSNGPKFVNEAYIKFDLSSLSRIVEEATLSLKVISNKNGVSLVHEARFTPDNSWDESVITWNTKPKLPVELIAEWEVPEENAVVKIDVTQYVNDAIRSGENYLSMVIRAWFDGYKPIVYASKEHAIESYRPYLEVTSKGEFNTLNFTEENVVGLAGRAEKLVRLVRKTGLSFEQLDWLIVNASKAIFEHGKKIILDKLVLEAIAEFKKLNKRYGITSDMFTAFIGEINTYAEADKKSFYQDTFSNVDGTTVPLGATLQFAIDKQGLYESICCGAMGVTADEFSRIGTYCFSDEKQQITVDETSMAQLYRLGKIPQMLGLSFREAELLWKIMAGGKDTLLRNMGSNSHSLETLDIIRQTDVLLDWMDTHQLDVVSLQSMITNQYSGTATPELYNLLAKVYQSIISVAHVTRGNEQDNLPAEKIYRALATEFNLKANVMAQIVNWIDKTNPDFTSKDFWDRLQSYFSNSYEDELTALEERVHLLRWCQQLGQYVIIVRWSGLNEQELTMMIEHPEWLLDGYNMVPKSSLHLLLVLSRLKEWVQRVQVSSDEALRYFAQVNSKNVKRDAVVNLLAYIHGWNETDTAFMNNYLFGDEAYPKNFEQLYRLESWFNVGKQLNIGSRTLGELVELMKENDVAENDDLITSVARSLIATVQSESNMNTRRG